jgi:hypothetical protein
MQGVKMKYVVFALLLFVCGCVKEEINTSPISSAEAKSTFNAAKAELPWIKKISPSKYVGKMCMDGMLFYVRGGEQATITQPLDPEGKPMKCPI